MARSSCAGGAGGGKVEKLNGISLCDRRWALRGGSPSAATRPEPVRASGGKTRSSAWTFAPPPGETGFDPGEGDALVEVVVVNGGNESRLKKDGWESDREWHAVRLKL